MLTDYKFKVVKRDGRSTVINVAIYEGSMQDVTDFEGKTTNRYVRTALLGTKTITLSGDKIDSELRDYFNADLATDKTREPIPAQKVLIK